MAGYIDVGAAIKVAEQAIKAREAAIKAVGIVRTDLRNAVEMGGATAEQKAWVAKNFPPRERTEKAPK